MNVRLERPEDGDASVEVERAAFGNEAEGAIVIAVRYEEGSFAFVAEEDDRIVGHVQLSRAWVGPIGILALGPIGVLPPRQRKGIGRTLIQAAVAEVGARGEAAVVLLGDPALYRSSGSSPHRGTAWRIPSQASKRTAS